MKQTIYILTVIIVLTIISCDRIKNKGQELADKTEEKVKDKSKDLVDKVVPHFDTYKPDTKFNKERFKEFLKVELTPDIKIFIALTMQSVLIQTICFHLTATQLKQEK